MGILHLCPGSLGCQAQGGDRRPGTCVSEPGQGLIPEQISTCDRTDLSAQFNCDFGGFGGLGLVSVILWELRTLRTN